MRARKSIFQCSAGVAPAWMLEPALETACVACKNVLQVLLEYQAEEAWLMNQRAAAQRCTRHTRMLNNCDADAGMRSPPPPGEGLG